MAHWPSSARASPHFALAVQCAMPSGSPLTQTLGSTKVSCVLQWRFGRIYREYLVAPNRG
jgi:hypothetical protein